MKRYHTILILIVSLLYIKTEGQTTILPDNDKIHYSGRTDFSDPTAVKLYYGGSYITTQFQGTSLKVIVSDENWGGENHIGFIIDNGTQIVHTVANQEGKKKITVASGLSDTVHSLTIIKRTVAGNGFVAFHGIELDNNRDLVAPVIPVRKIALYGDSVTEGVNAGNNINDREGGKSAEDGWKTFGNRLARRLNAEVYNNGLSGLAVVDGTGFHSSAGGPIGLQTTYTKLGPNLGRFSNWDFNNYEPNLVIMALGINDDGFVNNSNQQNSWKEAYKNIIRDLKSNKHPNADFVLTVPPLGYERTKMERLVNEIVSELNNPDIHYFDITVPIPPNHPNSEIHRQMGDQLFDFIRTLDISWGGSDPDPTPIGDVFYIKSKALNTYMRPQNNNLDSPIVLVEKDNSDWFKWERVARSDGYYHLKNIKTGMYFRPSRNDDGVDPDVNNDGIGALMLQKPTNWKGAWTQWKEVISDDGSSYHLQNKELQKFLRPVTVNSISQLEIVPNTFRGNYTRWIFEAAEGGNSSGSCEVTVRAAGSTGEEVIQLLIDDEFAFEWAITSTSLANYKATVPNGGNVKIRFMNDGNTSSGADKNLRVDKLTFGGVTIEAENVTRQGCGNNEWLWCGGYFDFGNLSCQNRSSISDNKDNLSEVFKTYPNPMTSDILTVIGPDLFRITVYDIQGGVVMDSDQISGKQTIDTQGLSNGLYIVKMYDYNSKSTKTNKIIVNKQ